MAVGRIATLRYRNSVLVSEYSFGKNVPGLIVNQIFIISADRVSTLRNIINIIYMNKRKASLSLSLGLAFYARVEEAIWTGRGEGGVKA